MQSFFLLMYRTNNKKKKNIIATLFYKSDPRRTEGLQIKASYKGALLLKI